MHGTCRKRDGLTLVQLRDRNRHRLLQTLPRGHGLSVPKDFAVHVIRLAAGTGEQSLLASWQGFMDFVLPMRFP